jgi:rfaE bifunctional protein kinase chain/domain
VNAVTRADVERLVTHVRDFARCRVAVLGDLMADEFLYGDIARISREAPVLVLEHNKTIAAPGGGGNSVANLQALGARTLPLGVVGRDASGRRLLSALRATGCATSGIQRLAGYETPTKARVMAGGVHTRRQQIVRLDRGAPRGELPQAVQASLRKELREALPQVDGVLVADYGYGAASPLLLRPLMSRLQKLNRPVTVDSRARVGEFHGLDACTPNQEEVEGALGVAALQGDAEIAAAGRELRRRMSAGAVLITRGAQGMSLAQKGRPAIHVPAYGSDDVADVTGAGDTVIATFTLSLIVGATASNAARMANYAAGLVVRKAGTATVSPGELIEAIQEDLTP